MSDSRRMMSQHECQKMSTVQLEHKSCDKSHIYVIHGLCVNTDLLKDIKLLMDQQLDVFIRVIRLVCNSLTELKKNYHLPIYIYIYMYIDIYITNTYKCILFSP